MGFPWIQLRLLTHIDMAHDADIEALHSLASHRPLKLTIYIFRTVFSRLSIGGKQKSGVWGVGGGETKLENCQRFIEQRTEREGWGARA